MQFSGEFSGKWSENCTNSEMCVYIQQFYAYKIQNLDFALKNFEY